MPIVTCELPNWNDFHQEEARTVLLVLLLTFSIGHIGSTQLENSQIGNSITGWS